MASLKQTEFVGAVGMRHGVNGQAGASAQSVVLRELLKGDGFVTEMVAVQTLRI